MLPHAGHSSVFEFVCAAAVCAEAYNPDEDEDDDAEPRVVHPKTDEQRHRLQEACKDILLFKTLEQVHGQSASVGEMERSECLSIRC